MTKVHRLFQRLLPLTLGLVVGFIFTPTSLFAQQIVSPTGNNLCWDQTASSLAEAQSFSYNIITDGSPKQILNNVVCSGNATPFTCQIGLPITTPGLHTVSVTTSTKLTDGTLLESVAGTFSYIIGVPPQAPSNFRIIKIIGSFLAITLGIFLFRL